MQFGTYNLVPNVMDPVGVIASVTIIANSTPGTTPIKELDQTQSARLLAVLSSFDATLPDDPKEKG